MADRIIKSDSGNDVVIQNNGGTRKIEVTNSGDVEVTGDVKTTTVKATNLKANDGTSGISIADSTGRVTFNENNPVITLGSNANFPAGHVIQTVYNEYNTANSTASTATSLTKCVTSGGANEFKATINNVLASSYVLIFASFVSSVFRALTEANGGFGFIRESSAIMTPRAGSARIQVGTGSYMNFTRQTTLVFLDQSPATGTNNYFLGSLGDGTSTVQVLSDSNYEPFRMLLQEIKQ